MWSESNYICRAMVWHYNSGTPKDSRVYMGLDGHLYSYNPADDYYTYLDSLEKLEDSGTQIEDLLNQDDDIDDYVTTRLWDISDGFIYGAAWKENRSDSKTIILFKWDLSNSPEGEMTLINIIDNVFIGERTYYEWCKNWDAWEKEDDPYYQYHEFYLGTITEGAGDSYERTLVIPFSQNTNIGNTYETYRESARGATSIAEVYRMDRYGWEFFNDDPYSNNHVFDINLNERDNYFGETGYFEVYPPSYFGKNLIFDENPHLGVAYKQEGCVNLSSNLDFLSFSVEKTKADKGPIHYAYWDDNDYGKNLEGYRKEWGGLSQPDIMNATSSGNNWIVEFDAPMEVDAYDHSYFNGCRLYVAAEFASWESYAYIINMSSNQALVTSLDGGSDWDERELDHENFMITAPHYKYIPRIYDVSDNSFSPIPDYTTLEGFDGDLDAYEKAFGRQPTSDKYINGKWHFSSFDSEDMVSYISKHKSTLDGTNIYDLYNFDDLIILDLKYANLNDSDYFIILYNDLEKFGTNKFYKLGRVLVDGSSDSIDVIETYSNLPLEFKKYDNNKFHLALNNGLVHDLDLGNIGTNSSITNILGGGDTFVDTETSLASNLVSISSTEINDMTDDGERNEEMVLGVSSPTPSLEAVEGQPQGKYYLWKLDNYIPDRIELADFEDMTIWEAISHLIRFSYSYVGGFAANEDGSFFLKKKSFDDNSPVILDVSPDVQDDNLISLQKDRGLDQIYNDVRLAPSRTKMSDTKYELVKTARSQDNFIKEGDVSLNISTSYPINLVMECMDEGKVNSVFNKVKEASLFRWSFQSQPVEVRALQDFNSNTDAFIIVHSTFRGQIPPFKDMENNEKPIKVDGAINVNDYIKLVDSNNNDEKYVKITNIRKDSADGFFRVLDLTDTTTSVDDLPNDINVEEGAKLEVSASIGLSNIKETFDSHWSSDGVAEVTSAHTFSDSSSGIVWADNNKFLGDDIVVGIGDDYYGRIKEEGEWSSPKGGWALTIVSSGETLNVSTGDTISAYYSPSKASTDDETGMYDYFSIPDTDVSIKIQPSNLKNVKFIEGDKINIDSEGLTLEEDKASMQIAKDVESIDRYGKHEFTDLDCKFLTTSQAYHYVKKIRSDFAFGRYRLKATIDYRPDLDFLEKGSLALVRVHNHPMFKSFDSIECLIEEIKHNIKGGTTTLTLRAVDPY